MSRAVFGESVVATTTGYLTSAPWVRDAADLHWQHQHDVDPQTYALDDPVIERPAPCVGQRIFWPNLDTLGAAYARGAVSTLD